MRSMSEVWESPSLWLDSKHFHDVFYWSNLLPIIAFVSLSKDNFEQSWDDNTWHFYFSSFEVGKWTIFYFQKIIKFCFQICMLYNNGRRNLQAIRCKNIFQIMAKIWTTLAILRIKWRKFNYIWHSLFWVYIFP